METTFVGYARVSTLDKKLALQLDALNAAGCTKLFVERIGSKGGAAPVAGSPRYLSPQDLRRLEIIASPSAAPSIAWGSAWRFTIGGGVERGCFR